MKSSLKKAIFFFFKKSFFLEIMKKLEMPKHGISIEYREIMLIN